MRLNTSERFDVAVDDNARLHEGGDVESECPVLEGVRGRFGRRIARAEPGVDVRELEELRERALQECAHVRLKNLRSDRSEPPLGNVSYGDRRGRIP